MSNVFLFAWDNYDDNPLDAIGVNTIPTQKEATYAPAAEGELVTDAFDTFMSNADNYAYPQVAEVAGEEAKVLVFGEGMVDINNNENILAAFSLFDCEMNRITFLYVYKETPTTAPAVTFTHNGETYNASIREGGVIDAEVVSLLQEQFAIDLSPFIGNFLMLYAANVEITEGDTYTFSIDGKQILTSEAVCLVIQTDEP